MVSERPVERKLVARVITHRHRALRPLPLGLGVDLHPGVHLAVVPALVHRAPVVSQVVCGLETVVARGDGTGAACAWEPRSIRPGNPGRTRRASASGDRRSRARADRRRSSGRRSGSRASGRRCARPPRGPSRRAWSSPRGRSPRPSSARHPRERRLADERARPHHPQALHQRPARQLLAVKLFRHTHLRNPSRSILASRSARPREASAPADLAWSARRTITPNPNPARHQSRRGPRSTRALGGFGSRRISAHTSAPRFTRQLEVARLSSTERPVGAVVLDQCHRQVLGSQTAAVGKQLGQVAIESLLGSGRSTG